MGRTKRYRCLKKRLRNTSQSPDCNIHHDLMKFLVNHGWKNESRLAVSSFKNTGRGLYSKSGLMENDTIIDLPFKCLISHYTIEFDKEFKNIFDDEKIRDKKGTISFQSLLAFYLTYNIVLEDKSPWHVYIKTLPADFSTPYFCKKSELYHLPDYILEKVVEQNNIIKSNYQHLKDILDSQNSNGIHEKMSLELFKYAYFVCNSRSVYINSKSFDPLVDHEPFFKELCSDECNMALAPMLDLLNHSDKATTRCQLSHCDRFIENNAAKIRNDEIKISYMLYTSNLWKKYDEIFINYGTYNNTKLFIEYGFVLPNNEMDFLEFTLEDINNYIKSHNELKFMPIPKHKYKFIRDHNLDQQMYIDTNDGLNHNFQAVLAILLLPQNLYNLTQVAFGDELNFNDIKVYAVEVIKRKRADVEKMFNGLKSCTELSKSAQTCLEYFCESQNLIDKVLNFIEVL